MKRSNKILANYLIVGYALLSASLYSQQLMSSKEAAHTGAINTFAMASDGSLFVTGGADAKSYLWNTVSIEKLKGAMKHNDAVLVVALNQNNKFYATGSADAKVRVFDIDNNQPARILSEHTVAVTALAFNPVTNQLATAALDNVIKLWDDNKNRNSNLTLPGHGDKITALSYSPDGKLLFSASHDKTIKVWDAATGQLVNTIETGWPVNTLAVSPDQLTLAAAGEKGTLVLWEYKSWTKKTEVKTGRDDIAALAYSADGAYIAAAGESKAVQIFNTSGKAVKEIPVREGGITGVGFTTNSDKLIVADKKGSLSIYDVTFLKGAGRVFPAVSGKAQIVASNISLKDANDNGLIDAAEKVSIAGTLKSNANSNAYGVTALISAEPVDGLSYPKQLYIGTVPALSSVPFTIPLQVQKEVGSASGTFSISFTEGNGATISQVTLQFQTGGASTYNYIMVMGQGFRSATGKAEIGAPITLSVKVKNIAKTEAQNIKVNFLLPENVKAVNKLSETVATIGPGEEKNIEMDFFADKNFTLPEIKMGVDIQGAAFTNAKDIIISLKMNEKLPMGEDYSTQVAMQTSELNSPQNSEPLYRGGANPLKGLNVNKPKEMVIGNYYALIIGIDRYKGAWSPLVNAVNDAKAIETMLKGKYKFDHLKSFYNEQATREAIIRELEWLAANAKENDNVFIYYSGHGEYKKELSRGYWVPVDAETNSTSKYISNSDIQTYISGIQAKHTLLVSDACFSGDIFRGNTLGVPFEESEKYYREVHSIPSRQAFTSGGIEPVMDGGKNGHSVFAYYFLKALEGNNEKFMDVTQVYTKIKIPIINNSDQTPKLAPIKNTGDEGGQFIFIKKQ